jgi:hypothetical protein
MQRKKYLQAINSSTNIQKIKSERIGSIRSKLSNQFFTNEQETGR